MLPVANDATLVNIARENSRSLVIYAFGTVIFTLVIALLCTALSLVAGLMLGKVYFSRFDAGTPSVISRDSHKKIMERQQSRYRRKVHAFHNMVKRHEDAQADVRERLAGLEGQLEQQSRSLASARAELAGSQERCAASENEMGLLKIEREELRARIARIASERSGQPAIPVERIEAQLVQYRAEVGTLRELLASRDHALKQAERQVDELRTSERQANARLADWKRRMQPLSNRLRQQQAVIRGLQKEPDTLFNVLEEDERDDLQAIRGIGPALEKRLLERGIKHFDQLAQMSTDDLSQMATELSIAPTRPLRDQWIEQARELKSRRSA